MRAKERIDLFEEDSKVLESISKNYAADSKEYSALKHAAIALWLALTADRERFKEYIRNFDGDLTQEQRAHLISIGIDPDADLNSK
jgi:hypothetical protein